MTTAFAWFVRGDLVQSWRANPAGLGIAGMVVPLIPWLVVSAAIGRPWGLRSAGELLTALTVVAAGLTVVTWIVRRSLFLV